MLVFDEENNFFFNKSVSNDIILSILEIKQLRSRLIDFLFIQDNLYSLIDFNRDESLTLFHSLPNDILKIN